MYIFPQLLMFTVLQYLNQTTKSNYSCLSWKKGKHSEAEAMYVCHFLVVSLDPLYLPTQSNPASNLCWGAMHSQYRPSAVD